MKKHIVLLITILFLYSCNKTRSESENRKMESNGSIMNNHIESKTPFKPKSDSIPPILIDGIQKLSFKFNVDSTGYNLKTIRVYSENTQIQNISANKYFDRKEFNLIDWNFDGYKDISVRNNCGSGGCAYWIWNYNPKTKNFIYNKDLSEKLGLEIDSISKTNIFHYRAGWPEESWNTYKYENNKLIFVKGLYKQQWNDSLGNSWVKNTHSKIVKGRKVYSVDSLKINN